MHNKSTLLLGGARSGKSSLGEKLALEIDAQPIYIATAEPRDGEMQERIRRHQDARADENWLTVEEPIELAQAISAQSLKGTVVLVDCITLWLSNIMATEKLVEHESDRLLQAIKQAPCPVILISNEVGMGIVPINSLAREFRDEAGRLNQKLAASFPNCHLVVAGLPLPLKKGGKSMVGNLV